MERLKIRSTELEYYVFYMWNGKLERMNILEGLAFKRAISDNIQKCKGLRGSVHIVDKKSLIEYLRRYFMYYYWSKSEMEYGVCDLISLYNPERLKEGYKLDVWYQIEPNLNMIADYIIYKMNIKFEGEKKNEK